MIRLIFSLGVAFIFGVNSIFAQANDETAELTAIKKTVDSLYNALSFEEGGKADTAQFLSLFLEHGTLINNNRQTGRVLSPSEFAKGISSIDGIVFFSEQEIWGETQFFGNIAHRYSVYDKHIKIKDREIKGKGVNSYQLVKVNGRWMVNSIIWMDETEDLKVPTKR